MPKLHEPKAHIRLDPEGRPWIEGTTIKVIEVALDHIVHGWSAEEIHFQHYGGIGMGRIHAALAYYFDNQPAMDAEIEKQIEEVERLRQEQGESPFALRMRQLRGK